MKSKLDQLLSVVNFGQAEVPNISKSTKQIGVESNPIWVISALISVPLISASIPLIELSVSAHSKPSCDTSDFELNLEINITSPNIWQSPV
jgi:hypothetical protein